MGIEVEEASHASYVLKVFETVGCFGGEHSLSNDRSLKYAGCGHSWLRVDAPLH